jgi:hypothetical protein
VSDETGGAREQGPKNPLRRTLDLCVFAPVGLAVTVVEDLPDLIAKGRRRVELELGNARVVGRFVVNRGQRRVSGHLDDLLHGTADGEVDDEDVPGTEPVAAQPGSTATEPVRPPRDSAAAAVVSGALADYDTLSASQVVPRLESLGTDELEAVLRYEASHRNRRTIMRRASQLLDEGTDGTGHSAAPAPQPGTAE